MKIDHKVVPLYAVKENEDRCHVNLLDLYMKKVPKEALRPHQLDLLLHEYGGSIFAKNSL